LKSGPAKWGCGIAKLKSGLAKWGAA
jgi:hypothetical protein